MTDVGDGGEAGALVTTTVAVLDRLAGSTTVPVLDGELGSMIYNQLGHSVTLTVNQPHGLNPSYKVHLHLLNLPHGLEI